MNPKQTIYSLILCVPQQTVNYLRITRAKGVCSFLCETFITCVFKFAACMGLVLISSQVFNNGVELHNWFSVFLNLFLSFICPTCHQKALTVLWKQEVHYMNMGLSPQSLTISNNLELPWIYFDQLERYHDFKNLDIYSNLRETMH